MLLMQAETKPEQDRTVRLGTAALVSGSSSLKSDCLQ
jgi:hypothetical protein